MINLLNAVIPSPPQPSMYNKNGTKPSKSKHNLCLNQDHTLRIVIPSDNCYMDS